MCVAEFFTCNYFSFCWYVAVVVLNRLVLCNCKAHVVVFTVVLVIDINALTPQNAKFGFGGKKRGMKRNTSASSADMSAFRPSLHSQSSSAKRRKVAAKRPGKARRAKMRQRKGKR